MLGRTYVSIRDFHQIATITNGEVTQIVPAEEVGMIPSWLAVDTNTHCLYVTNHSANPENRIIKLCEPAKKQLAISALKRTIERCVEYKADQKVLLSDVDEVVRTSGSAEAIEQFNDDVDDLAGECIEELGGLSIHVWDLL